MTEGDIRSALERILDADDDGDGHEFIHAMRDAKKLLGRKLNQHDTVDPPILEDQALALADPL
jgi:hypothetical protein